MSEQSPPKGDRALLVPLAETVTARDTVDHAVAQAGTGEIHLVVALGEGDEQYEDRRQDAEFLLQRAAAWAEEDARGQPLTIETHVLGAESYLFGPNDYARLFADCLDTHGLDAIVLDPEYWANTTAPLVESFRNEIEARGVTVETPVTPRPAQHERIVGRWDTSKVLTVFVISFGFYLVLGDPFYWFDIITGFAVAGIVALSLSHITYGQAPTYPRSAIRTVRFSLYIPYLVYEIIKANIVIAIVILRPSMPIDPRMTRVRMRVRGGLPTLALANSITLTPGTLTVRASSDELIIHTLVPSAREDLFGGRLERAIRFVFEGRAASAIPSPEEREDARVLERGEDW